MSRRGVMSTRIAVWACLLLSVADLDCSSTSTPPTTPSPQAQGCRTYATQWVSTSTFGSATTSSASFSTADNAYTERSPAGSSQIVRRTVYGSTADFLDDARTVGRFFYLR